MLHFQVIKNFLKKFVKNADFFEKPRIIICEYLRFVEFNINKEKKLKLNFDKVKFSLVIQRGGVLPTFLDNLY